MRAIPTCLLVAGAVAASGIAEAERMPVQPVEMKQEWAVPTTWAFLQAPAIRDTTLYLMIEMGKLAAISLRTGEVLAQVSPPERGPYATPAIEGDTLYLSSANSNVSSYHLPDMTRLWSTYFVPPGSFHGNVHPLWVLGPAAIAPNALLVASQDGHLYCLNRADGAIRWRSRSGASAAARPLVRGNLVFTAGSDSYLTAVDIGTGNVVWRSPLGETVEFTSPALHGENVLIAGRGGTVLCISATAGEIRWRSSAGRCIRGDLAVADRLLCVADSTGVVGIDPDTGHQLWSRPIAGDSPAISAERVFFHAKNGDLLVLDGRTGETIASSHAGPPGFFGQPLVVDRHVVVAGHGSVRCFASP